MPAPTSLAGVLDWHRQRYPLLQARDVYKLVHQGVFGPGHIITSAAGARRALVDELAALQVQSLTSKVQRQTEPEFEPIDPGGRLVRVNLRPFLREGGGRKAEGGRVREERRRHVGCDWLVTALVESASMKGSHLQMARRLSAAIGWCRASLPVQAAELEEIAARARDANYPAFHHSPAYRRAYQPAYRVVILPEDWAQE
jgi:hypothetical protein